MPTEIRESRSGTYPARPGNEVAVRVDAPALEAVYRAATRARRSVWIAVAFVDLDFKIPGLGVSWIDFVSDLAASGIDVRCIFWQSDTLPGAFHGEPEEIERLRSRGCRVKMRWDSIPRGCQHQKIYVIDGEVAFVGGINIAHRSIDGPDHKAEESTHDLFAEIRGPCVLDCAHNFVQRWNEAVETRKSGKSYPSLEEAGPLEWPRYEEMTPRGSIRAQIVRTIRHSLYEESAPVAGRTGVFDISSGEKSIREAYLQAIGAARKLIYIENQSLADLEAIDALIAAAERGLDVIVLVPGEPPKETIRLYLKLVEGFAHRLAAALEAVKRHPRIRVYRIASPVAGPDGRAGVRPIYVHAKLLLIDDAWLNVGSANIWYPSFHREGEMNLSVWSAPITRGLREALWNEHLNAETGKSLRAVPIEEGAQLFADSADRNASVLAQGELPPGRLHEVDPARYYLPE